MIKETEQQQTWLLNEQLRQRIVTHLGDFIRQQQTSTGMRQAAVALVLTNIGVESLVNGIPTGRPDEAGIILTRRSENLGHHAGQWALPGGGADSGESPEEAALRELNEEVGLRLNHDDILGRLDDFTTRSGFTITPVVFWGGEDLNLIANPAEVESIHRIPLREFMRDDAPVLESIPESNDPVLLMPVGQGWIASPTGAILYQFREVALNGRNIRVSHYEQPYFAWQ